MTLMRSTSTPRRCVAVVAVVGALVLACGGKDGPAAAAPEAPESSVPAAGEGEVPDPVAGEAPSAAPVAGDGAAAAAPAEAPGPSLYGMVVETHDGQERELADYEGQVLLIVNTATACGFTPQVAELATLRSRFAHRGFEILAFPSDDFDQDPGSATESAEAMAREHGATFPVFAKARVRGDDKSPLFELLTRAPGGEAVDVRWNFTKFLVDTEGQVIARFEPRFAPLSDEVLDAIERVLPR